MRLSTRSARFCCAVLLFFGIAVLHNTAYAQGTGKNPLPRLGSFLNPDGSFNDENGYSGSIDARGWDIQTMPDGSPRFVRSDAGTELPAFARPSVSGDEYWEDGFGDEPSSNGVNDEVFALASDNVNLYIGGIFSKAGDVEANNIVIWNGVRWQIMGTGPGVLNGVNGSVNAIAVSGDIVYVGGQFTNAGGTPVQNIARYSKSSKTWAKAGGGVSGNNAFVSSLVVDGDQLFVGGTFTTAGGRPANNVAVWDINTGQWSALGAGVEGNVNALAKGPDGLYVGGSFSSAGGVASNSVARWDGAQWYSLAGGVNGFVNAIAVLDSSVFVGGGFDKAGDTVVNNVARWRADSGIWSRLSGLFELVGEYSRIEANGVGDVVRDIVIDGNSVYVSGTFRSAAPGDFTLDEISTNYVARWFEPTEVEWWRTNRWWASLGRGGTNGTNGFVNALALFDDGLYVGGAFSRAGGQSAGGIAKWDGARWFNLSTGAKSIIFTLTVNDDDEVYVGGEFNQAGSGSSTRLARLGQGKWDLINGSIGGTIYSIASQGDWVYIGGSFERAGGVDAKNVVRWNRTTNEWSALGSSGGPTDESNRGFVSAITLDGDDVYLGGEFTVAGGVTATNLVRWNSATDTWTSFGGGVTGPVFSIVVDGADVYAGGRFLGAGQVRHAKNVALWRDDAWHALDTGTSDVVWAMALRGSELFVGGEFVRAGSMPANNVAIWNVESEGWHAAGDGVTGDFIPGVNSVSVSAKKVYVAGSFTRAGEVEAANIASWDGGWTNLGSGVDSYIYKAVVHKNKVYVTGAFSSAGAKPSLYFGIYNDPALSIERERKVGTTVTMQGNAPNPFHQTTAVSFRTESPDHITLSVHDVNGKPVHMLVDETLPAGEHRIVWDAEDLAAGVYFCRLEVGGQVLMSKMVKH